jgi:hypothetical protein
VVDMSDDAEITNIFELHLLHPLCRRIS